VEFTNVPPGITIAAQSTDGVQVWLRGTDCLFDSVKLEVLVARCDLKSAHDGKNAIGLAAGAFNVPFGPRIEGFTPRQITVRLERNSVAPEQP